MPKTAPSSTSTAALTAYCDAKALTAALQLATTSGALTSVLPVTWRSLTSVVSIFFNSTRLFLPEPAASTGGGAPQQNVEFNITAYIFRIPIVLELRALLTTSAGDDPQIVIKNPSLVTPGEEEQALSQQSTGDISWSTILNIIEELVEPWLLQLAFELPVLQIQELYGSDINAKLVGLQIVPTRKEALLAAQVELGEDKCPKGACFAPGLIRFPSEAALSRGSKLSLLSGSKQGTHHSGAGGGVSNPDVVTGQIYLMVSEAATNMILAALIDSEKPYDLNEKDKLVGRTKVGIQSTVRVDSIVLDLERSETKARAKILFEKTLIGIRLFGGWSWTRLRIKSARAKVDIRTDTDEHTAWIVLEEFKKLRIRLKSRRLLHFPTELLNEIINIAIKAYLPKLNDNFHNETVELLTLPEMLPGTKIPVHFDFVGRGLWFAEGVSLGRISIDGAPGGDPLNRPPTGTYHVQMQSGASTLLLDPWAPPQGAYAIRVRFTVQSPSSGSYGVLVSDLLSGNARVFPADSNAPQQPDTTYEFTYPASRLTQLLWQVNWSLNGSETLTIDLTMEAVTDDGSQD